ncbi:unnamed protein product [Schistosoma mattheei]|uniref:Uncharacterized protein n=1 Tax=Schistosoma mattheei TaxID=31246 RepID=A0A183NFI6_9TREM|nr:unnamed protein product [Schistosoma mattheei]
MHTPIHIQRLGTESVTGFNFATYEEHFQILDFYPVRLAKDFTKLDIDSGDLNVPVESKLSWLQKDLIMEISEPDIGRGEIKSSTKENPNLVGSSRVRAIQRCHCNGTKVAPCSRNHVMSIRHTDFNVKPQWHCRGL